MKLLNKLTNHKQVIRINKPKISLMVPIHLPGLGNNNATLGNSEINNHGNAIPKPNAVNIANSCQVEAPNANPTAVPKKGAVQGVASNVANTPCK